MKLLLDEMYSPGLRQALVDVGIEATTVIEQRLGGASDAEVFAFAQATGQPVLTENVEDFTRLAAEHSLAGRHHSGVLIALSSRFSRRPAGMRPLVEAIRTAAQEPLGDRVVYLKPPRA